MCCSSQLRSPVPLPSSSHTQPHGVCERQVARHTGTYPVSVRYRSHVGHDPDYGCVPFPRILFTQYGWGIEQTACRSLWHDLFRRSGHAGVCICDYHRIFRGCGVCGGEEQPVQGGQGTELDGGTYDHTSTPAQGIGSSWLGVGVTLGQFHRALRCRIARRTAGAWGCLDYNFFSAFLFHMFLLV